MTTATLQKKEIILISTNQVANESIWDAFFREENLKATPPETSSVSLDA